MEGFTASKYEKLVLDKKPKVDMSTIDKALVEGRESFTFFQHIHETKEDLENSINNHLKKYNDSVNIIVAKVENLENESDIGMTTFKSLVVLSIVRKPAESVYLKEQGKKFVKESYVKKEKVSKYDKKKQ